MQQISSTIGQDTHKRATEVKTTYRNIRARSTGASQIHTDNSFLKEEFAHVILADVMPNSDFSQIVNPAMNIQKLVKAASNYLSLYGTEFSFTPCGKFGQDIHSLIKTVTPLFPENQMLNVDYISNEFVFIVYQSHPKFYWNTITYIPVSIAHTMRPTIRKLFIRFIAFIMQQNNLPTIKDTYNYEFIVEDIKNNMQSNSEDFVEVDQETIDTMRSYDNKTGKASKLLKQISQYTCTQHNTLLIDLKKLKRLSAVEKEQVACMIRGVELMSRNLLGDYTYNHSYDDYNGDSEYDDESVDWKDLICVSWDIGKKDPLAQCHYEMLNAQCQNSLVTEPISFSILSATKAEKLIPSSFPFEWLDYICDDYFNYLVQDENE